jgi:hypothetical protein
MKVLANLIFTIFLNPICFAQSHNDNVFDFLATSIKDTYAGYSDKVKGAEFDRLVSVIKHNPSKDTFALLSRMTTFFKDQHLVLQDFEIGKQVIDTQQCKKDSESIGKYFLNRKKKAKYEGYWLSEYNNCIIALKKVKEIPETYYGYVVESKVKVIPGYVILKMVIQKDGTYFTDYVEENFGYRIFLNAKFKDITTLWVNSYGKWRRIANYEPTMLQRVNTFSYEPEFVKIDTNTVVLKMHDFSGYNVRKFDSIIRVNGKVIEQAKTLIVDLRNNMGGTISNYRPLFPYAYTGPILHCGVNRLYSAEYIKDYEATIKRLIARGDTSRAQTYTNRLDAIKSKKGQFVFYEADTIAKGFPILVNPKNIAIIINNNCLSAAELMLLNFKQSSKVKLFGERTGGALDYLDALSLTLPKNKYSLFVATAKRVLTAQQPSYDATGIKPDIEISDSVADWITFVKKYYEHQ